MASGSGYRVQLVELVVLECGWWDYKSQLSVAPLEGVSSFTLRLHCRWKHMSRLVFFCCVKTTSQWSLKTRLGVHYMEYQCTHRTVLVFLAGLSSPLTSHPSLFTHASCAHPHHVPLPPMCRRAVQVNC